jgi:hypothetical protein
MANQQAGSRRRLYLANFDLNGTKIWVWRSSAFWKAEINSSEIYTCFIAAIWPGAETGWLGY